VCKLNEPIILQWGTLIVCQVQADFMPEPPEKIVFIGVGQRDEAFNSCYLKKAQYVFQGIKSITHPEFRSKITLKNTDYVWEYDPSSSKLLVSLPCPIKAPEYILSLKECMSILVGWFDVSTLFRTFNHETFCISLSSTSEQ